MKYYSQYRSHDLFELQESLSGLSKSNRWVKLADHLPWDRIEKEYNKRLRNSHNGAGNKPARMVVEALIVKHVEKLSDEKTIQAIQENPYMQYLLGLEKFTEKPVFVPELFVLVRKRLDHDFFNMLTLMLAETDGSKPKKEHTDEDGNDHGGTMKIDATCCDAEVRYPTDSNLLEDGSRLIDRLLDKFCARHKVKKPQTHRTEARQAFIGLIKKKRKGKKLFDKTKLIQIRCLQADFQLFLDFLGKQSSTLLACFSRHDYKCLQAAFKMCEQQKMMFEQNVRRCADRIISIYQPHLRPIVRGKAKATVEFGAKIGASIVSGYTYVDHVSWDAYNESSDLGMQLELYKKRFGMLPREVQADKLYLGKENRKHIKSCHVNCYNRPLGRPPKEENDTHAEDKKRAIGERNEIEGTFGTTKRVYRANDIRAKLDQTADTWIGACFFAKNIMKFLRGLLCLIFEKSGLKTFQKRIMSIFDSMEAVLPTPQGCMKEIN
ncbi:IS5 family transposase [Hallella colorans]|uniref:IS5 family transposase n=1 Tax=Hallella colorans TaxID=1703337 RepID=UPI0023F4CC9F|nr:IS5 family transposase [Hallella colorans]